MFYVKKLIVILSLISVNILADPSNEVKLQVTAKQHAKMKLSMMLVGSDQNMESLAGLVKKALEFSGQWAVDLTTIAQLPTKKELAQLWQEGVPYVVFLDGLHPESIQWRLYETQHATMIKGKKMAKTGSSVRGWAYALADALWLELTGNAGFFSAKIAFCKEINHGKGHPYKHIYIADYDGTHQEPLVTTPTINVSPRWNKDFKRPLVFYSENTNSNMRLMATTLDKHRIMASNFEGLNMQPTFSPDGQRVVYCATRGSGSCQLLSWKNRTLARISHNEGNNLFPSFSDDGKKLYYCSDFEHPNPLIYALDIANGTIEKITNQGYCVSPTSCDHKGLLGYCKMVNGIMQLFTYNWRKNEHKQLTFDRANKEECMFTPCGTYLLCSISEGKKSRIALFNIITGRYHYLTSMQEHCSYPALSGNFAQYPAIS